MKVYIDYGQGFKDYTQYVIQDSLTIEDSINVPNVVNFQLSPNDAAFVVPKRSSYVKIVSEVYAEAGGYLPSGQDALTFGKIVATGFITNELERDFVGMGDQVGYAVSNFQFLTYRVNVSSDEWFLNTRFVPFIPAFINQTQGQILANLAQALAPGFFDVTSFVASGDLVPYYEYDPTQTWSDIAKTFADSSRYRVKIRNRVIYYEPFGDQPLGISYDEATQKQSQFNPSALTTSVLTVPPVNDALVLGAEEPQDLWDNYFVGDGFSTNFQLLYSSFRGSSVTLQSDDWTETSFDNSQWTVMDPYNVFSLVGALNVNQMGASSAQLGVTYVVAKNGIEIGGAINIQAGEFEFVDASTGIVGGVYTDSSLLASACFAGFNISASSQVVLTSSGAGGIIIQPMLFGVPVGPTVVTQPNHHYQLQIWVGGNQFDRYNSIYKNLNGSTQYGGNALAGYGQVTFVIGDIDIGIVVANQYGPQSIGPPVPVVPQLTKYTESGLTLPTFGVFAPVNGTNLNLAVNYSLVAQPPQGTLNVQSLTGASGGLLPVLPQNVGQPVNYLLGAGFQNQTATITQAGDVDQLSFYSDTIPGVGSRIRFQSWESGVAISRVQNPVAITQEAAVSGDNGVRSAIFTNLSPQPRTSDECELAAAAVITDRSYPQFQGSYQVFSIPYYYENIFDGKVADYPTSGRYFYINAPVRAVSGSNFFTSTVRMQVIDLRGEILQIEIDYGPDLYLEKLLQNFIERSDKLLTPKETQKSPTPIQLQNAGAYYLPPFQNARVTNIVNTISGSFITVDLGSAPVTAAEVRRIDGGWGTRDSNFIGLFTTQQFTLLRTAHDQHWFIRPVNGGQTSRFSYVPRINYPLIPGQPFPKALDVSNPLSPVITFDYPQQNVTPGFSAVTSQVLWQAPAGALVSLSRYNGVSLATFDNSKIPQPGGFSAYRTSSIQISGSPDPTFNGIFPISALPASNWIEFTQTGLPNTVGSIIVTNIATAAITNQAAVFVDATYNQSSQNPFVSDVYGLEIRGPDNKQVILQRVVTAPSDLIVQLNSSSLSGLVVQGQISATGGYLVKIFPYFFNLIWDYSYGYSATFDPATTGCCADCIDPLDYGAAGDGGTDDTLPVQKALDVAAFNAGDASVFGGSAPPVTISGEVRAGTVVCLKSGYKFAVSPQGIDLASPTSSGFGPQAYCLKIGSGVKMKLDGELLLATSSTSGAFLSVPWCILTNRHSYQGGDSNITVEGDGTFNAQSNVLSFSVTSARKLGVNNVSSTAIKICGNYAYVVDTQAQVMYKISVATGAVVAQSPYLGSYFVQGGIGVLTQIECDSAGNVYLGLGGAGDFGAIVELDSVSMSPLGYQGYSGGCGGITAGIPKYCDNCQSVFAPCFGNPGDLVYVPPPVPGKLGFIAMVDRIGVGLWTDVPVMQEGTMEILDTITCAPVICTPGYNVQTGAGVFNYAGGGLSSEQNPPGSSDVNGNVFVLCHNGSTMTLTQCNVYTGTQLGCACCCCGCTFHGVSTFKSVSNVNLAPTIGSGSPVMGACPDGTQMIAQKSSAFIYKYDPNSMTIISSFDLSPYDSSINFDRHSFRTIDQVTGYMIIRGNNSFITFDSVNMQVVGVAGNVAAQTGGIIPSGLSGEIAYDPGTGSILFAAGGSLYKIGLQTGSLSGLLAGCIKFQGANQTEVRDVKFQQFNTYGFYGAQCKDTLLDGCVIPTGFNQFGSAVIMDESYGTLVSNWLVDGSNSTGGLTFVTDYAGKGLSVTDNSIYAIGGDGVRHTDFGLEDGLLVPQPSYARLVVSGNLFASGTDMSSAAINLSEVGLECGITLTDNNIIGNAQYGIVLGNVADCVVTGNVVVDNTIGLLKSALSVLTRTAIINNTVSQSTSYDIAAVGTVAHPTYPDSKSTCTMHNPAVDVTFYKSWSEISPSVEGTVSGKAGYVFPPAPPNSYYAVFAAGSTNSPVVQNGTAASYLINSFYIQWTDKTVLYAGVSVAITPPHGYATYYVFVDDPYRTGDPAQIQYGVTTVASDLATSAGRYFLGAITLTAAGGAQGSGAGNIPGAGNGSGTLPSTQPYEIGCTFDGLISGSYVLTRLPMTRQITFAANLAPSQGYLNTGPTGTWTAVIAKNGTQFGTMTFAAGANKATFSSTLTVFQPGDVLTVVAPSIQDTTASDIGFILSALRNFVDTPLISLILSDSLNSWNDAVAQTFPALTLSLSDSISNWNDSFTTGLNLISLALSDNMNFWADSLKNNFPGLTLSLSDNLNSWQDVLAGALS